MKQMDAQKTLKTTELQIVERPAMTVVGMLYHGKAGGPEIPALWGKFAPRMASVPEAVNPAVSYGVCRDMDWQTGMFDYLAAVEVTADAPVPEDMVRWEVPGGLFALIPTTLQTVHDGYAQAETIIPAAGYRRIGNVDYELYDERFDPDQPGSVFYICVPVEKA
jgi:AraC family transcriptional regulator